MTTTTKTLTNARPVRTASGLRSGVARRALVAAVAVGSMTVMGCSNAGEGAISGSLLGAGSGLAIGSLTGSAGKGAIIGALAGGIGGAILGDQNERKDRRGRVDDYDRRNAGNYEYREDYREYRDDRPVQPQYQPHHADQYRAPNDDVYYERGYERSYERRYENPR